MAWFPRSLAGQMFVLHAFVIAVVVLAGGVLAVSDARRHGDEIAREEVTGIAVALADSPSTAEALISGNATAVLQPLTEAVSRADAGDCPCIAFVTIMAPDGTRLTHTNPDLIGQRYQGVLEPALHGQTFTDVSNGPFGLAIRTTAPVRDTNRGIVGLVSVGITNESLAARWRSRLAWIGVISVGALAVSFFGVWAIRRRLWGQTRGLAPDELRAMYDHHEAILQSITEGLIVVEPSGVVVVNNEARRLLKLPDGDIDRVDLPAFLQNPELAVRDEVRVTDERVLVISRSPVSDGSAGSEVITIRDRTELQGALGELNSLRTFTDSLRAQAHEFANKLHTVVTMVELGHSRDAVTFATKALATSQQLVDRLNAAVREPAVAALLLAKTAEADERGVALTIAEDTRLDAISDNTTLTPQQLVTVLGNLIDNAFDACDMQDPWVEVGINDDGERLLIHVADSGPGMDAASFERAMQRGYSTKTGDGSAHQGLGLALIAQIAKQHHGEVTAEVTYGSVITVIFQSRSRP